MQRKNGSHENKEAADLPSFIRVTGQLIDLDSKNLQEKIDWEKLFCIDFDNQSNTCRPRNSIIKCNLNLEIQKSDLPNLLRYFIDGYDVLLLSQKPTSFSSKNTPAILKKDDDSFEFILTGKNQQIIYTPAKKENQEILKQFFEKHYSKQRVFLNSQHPIIQILLKAGTFNKDLKPWNPKFQNKKTKNLYYFHYSLAGGDDLPGSKASTMITPYVISQMQNLNMDKQSLTGLGIGIAVEDLDILENVSDDSLRGKPRINDQNKLNCKNADDIGNVELEFFFTENPARRLLINFHLKLRDKCSFSPHNITKQIKSFFINYFGQYDSGYKKRLEELNISSFLKTNCFQITQECKDVFTNARLDIKTIIQQHNDSLEQESNKPSKKSLSL